MPTCELTIWSDQIGPNLSDLAVDDQNHVFTAAAVGPDAFDPTNIVPSDSYIQMLTPGPAPALGAPPAAVTVKRWKVGGGAGFCDGAGTGPCLSGIAVHPGNRSLVYYSEPVDNNIGELNITNGHIRRWNLTAVGADVFQPRQLHVDRSGKVWVVTGSGDLVSLDPCTSRMTRHQIPLGADNDPFGVAPDDDVVGYTASNASNSKVGMVHPKGNSVPVVAACDTICPIPFSVDVTSDRSYKASGCKLPDRKIVDGLVTRKTDGTFVEALITSGNDSTMPLGITPAKARAEGTFFYAVGATSHVDPITGTPLVNRIGFVRLTPREKMKHGRDEDDPDDGWDDGANHEGPDGHHGHPHHSHYVDGNDSDDDGFDNDYDSPSHENVQVVDDAPALVGGQSVEYPVTTSVTSLALIAMSTADDPLAQICVKIYDPMGLLVATSAPTPGVAVAPPVLLPAVGTYRVRITNYGVTPITHTPKLIVREPWN
jgi:hypothetical protein